MTTQPQQFRVSDPDHTAEVAKLVQAMASDTRVRERLAQLARETVDGQQSLLRHAMQQQAETLRGIGKREAALWILSNLSASTSAARARAVTAERLAILDELAPE